MNYYDGLSEREKSYIEQARKAVEEQGNCNAKEITTLFNEGTIF